MVDLNSPEKACEWYFASGMNFNVGPTDAAGQNFEGSWESLIRECIQNSLDAVKDTTKPVVVKFQFKSLTLNNYPNFFELGKHIKACLETFASAQKKYKPMLDYFKDLRHKPRIGYLQISDYNTKGMAYEEGNDSCNFSAFVRGLGVHGGDQEATGRGGAFGLGKSTIYKMSPFRTMFVSSYTTEKQYVFEGVASLTTHNMNGEKLSHIGYYDNNDGEPITEKDHIPSRFLRKEDEMGVTHSGTDIYVMGRSESDGDVKDIIRYVLTHYWLSIFKGKLIVEIVDSNKEKTTLNLEDLDDYMSSYFPSVVDNARNSMNPRPYYNAVAHVNDAPGSILIEKELPTIGKVELYLAKNRDAKNDRLAFFRMPCMMVMRKSTSQLRLTISSYGVYGAFVCVNSVGDKLLKQLENPAHNEWHEKHWTNSITERIEYKAYKVMDELRNFLSEEIEKFCKSKGKASLKMLGAGKYLYTIQDMVERDDDDNVVSPSEGILPGNKFVDEETGVKGVESNTDVHVTVPTPPIGLRPGNVTNMQGRATTDAPDEKPGGITVMVTPPSKHKAKTKVKNKGGDTEVSATPSDKPAATIVPVEYKVYANKDGNKVIHNVCISTKEAVDSALIQISSKREDGRLDTELEIADSFGVGTFCGMELHNIPLKSGDNMFKIRFNDNMKHVLYINVNLK